MTKLRKRFDDIEDENEEDRSPRIVRSRNILKERFRRLAYDGKNVLVQDAASAEDIAASMVPIKEIDPNWDETTTTRSAVEKYPDLIETSRRTRYQLLVVKCRDPTCPLFHEKIRMSLQIFEEFIGTEPTKNRPVPDVRKDRFEDYEAL